MEQVETYLNNGILTNETYQEIKAVALICINKRGYHKYLNIDREHLACELVEHVIERLSLYDANRNNNVRSFIMICIQNHLKNLVRYAFNPKRHGERVVRMENEDGKEVDILDIHSFNATNEGNFWITDNKDYMFCFFSYLQNNAHKHFKGKALEGVRLIVEKIQSGRSGNNCTVKLIARECGIEIHFCYEIIKKIRAINHRLFGKWLKGEELQ